MEKIEEEGGMRKEENTDTEPIKVKLTEEK
ncbi:hypothetical protein CCACVL1_23274 [Corchorus capsularis]|uniref:Uncharacterized protein n=1 Tax=Corchorus capsularis TaxID=210143 RepID=A0A1R3GUI1_COCAP|nr:hypothetical protein CCACVL1_23274 [Corchorus capsularis]